MRWRPSGSTRAVFARSPETEASEWKLEGVEKGQASRLPDDAAATAAAAVLEAVAVASAGSLHLLVCLCVHLFRYHHEEATLEV